MIGMRRITYGRVQLPERRHNPALELLMYMLGFAAIGYGVYYLAKTGQLPAPIQNLLQENVPDMPPPQDWYDMDLGEGIRWTRGVVYVNGDPVDNAGSPQEALTKGRAYKTARGLA